MRRKSHHGKGDGYIILTYWKVSNFIATALLNDYHIAYYKDTDRIHYWKDDTKEYHIISIDNINLSKTGIENGLTNNDK